MAFRVTGILGLDGTGFQQTLVRAEASVNRFGRSVGSALSGRVAALFSVGALGFAAKKTIDFAESMVDLSARTGVAVEDLQRFKRAADENGASIEALAGVWKKLAQARDKALKDPTGDEAKLFQKFGINAGQLKSQSPADFTRTMSATMQANGNVQNFSAALTELGGKGADILAGAFMAGLDKNYQDIKVMSQKDAESLDDLKDKFGAFATDITVSLAPAITWLIDKFYVVKDTLEVVARVVQFAGERIWAALALPFKLLSSNPLSAPDIIKNYFAEIAEGQKVMDEEIAAMMQNQADDAAQRAADEAARAAARAARRDFEPPEPDPDKTKTKATPQFNQPSGGLVSVGNFLGQSQGILEVAAQQQVRLLTRIDSNMQKVADRLATNYDSLPVV